MNEIELRYGDCRVKRLSGGTLNAAMRNLEKFHYAGTHLGVLRITGELGCPIGRIEKEAEGWQFQPEGDGDPYFPRRTAAELMGDIKAHLKTEAEVD